MAKHPNIYSTVVLDLPPRLKDVLLQFARAGQIDCDATGFPYLISVQPRGGNNVEAYVSRNGTLASIILNTRTRVKEPELSWDPNDGYRAATQTQQVGAKTRRERQMRESESPYSGIVNQIMEDENDVV